jgi:DNA-3-methyladenine glycosylase
VSLPRSFYARPAQDVARDLLGKTLVRRTESGVARCRIVETEAYVGAHDLACHAAKGKTARNASMFGPPGRAYVYLVYGLHDMLNIVTGRDGDPQAVLIRAAEPLAGFDPDDPYPLRGPGKLCAALAITRADDGVDLVRGDLRLNDGAAPDEVTVTARIGVDYAGAWKDAPLRFFDERSPHVSRRARRRGA